MPDERSLRDDDSRHTNDYGRESSCDDDLAPSVHKFMVLPEIPTLLFFIALVTQYPVLQFWLYDHFSKEYHWVKGNESDFCSNNSQLSNSTDNLEEEVQSQSNKYIMYIGFISSLVAIFPTVFLGPLTDKFGRKFVFYISCLGLLGSLLMNVFICHFDLHPTFLFISSFFLGLSGSYGLFLAAAFGMVADITSAGKHRAVRVVILEGTMAIAQSVGVSTSGIWVEEAGYIWPLACSMGAVVLAAVFVLFLIPETYVGQHYHPFSCRILLKSFEFYVKDTANKRRFTLIACLICFVIQIGAVVGESNFALLYLLHQPFCWSKVEVTVFSGVVTLLAWILVMGFVLVSKRCISEPVFALIGTASTVSRYLFKGLAKSDVLIFVATGTGLMSDLVSPMCRAIMSKAVSQDEQGALFAGTGVLQLIVSAVGGVVMSAIYNVGLEVYLGLPYLVLAGFVSINFFFLIALIIHGRRYPAPEQPDGSDQGLIQ